MFGFAKIAQHYFLQIKLCSG